MLSIKEGQAEVMKSVADALKFHRKPPLDRGLRSILVQQVANLMRGGWPVKEIRIVAVDLALQCDRWNGHKKLTSLQARIEADDERRAEREHIERVALENAAGMDPAVIRGLGLERAALPGQHRFIPTENVSNACRICGGPVGVHT